MFAYRRKTPLEPLELRGRTFAWGSRTYVMGIINVTPDSFSKDGLGSDAAAAVAQARRFAEHGCDIIDIGGESTRPGHAPVTEEEELHRVLPAIEAVRRVVDIPISIDTFKPGVAAAALEKGADLVNCVWGAMPGIVNVAARTRAPLIVMHNKTAPEYAGDCVAEVIDSLRRGCEYACAQGVDRKHIIVDPGIGFGKTADHNIEILSRLDELVAALPYPLLVGTSRKSFIGKITGLAVDQRLPGTIATVALAIAAGADIVRVHDVEHVVSAAEVADAICRLGHAESPRPHQEPQSSGRDR